MKAKRVRISLAVDLADEVRAAAREDNVSISAWVGEAIAVRLRSRALRDALREYEAEHGPFTPEEIDEGRALLGLAASNPATDVPQSQ